MAPLRSVSLSISITLAATDARGCTDAGRAAEGMITRLDHHQAIDLAELATLGVDQDGVAQDSLVQAGAELVNATNLGVYGLLDLLGHRSLSAPARPAK